MRVCLREVTQVRDDTRGPPGCDAGEDKRESRGWRVGQVCQRVIGSAEADTWAPTVDARGVGCMAHARDM